MEKKIYSTKKINNKNYIEIEFVEGYFIIFAFKEGDLFDYHIISEDYSKEIKNAVHCFMTIHEDKINMDKLLEMKTCIKAITAVMNK